MNRVATFTVGVYVVVFIFLLRIRVQVTNSHSKLRTVIVWLLNFIHLAHDGFHANSVQVRLL